MKQKISIFPGGGSKIEGLEKSEECHKLGEMARAAGKVTSQKKKDHDEVYQDVHAKGGN